MPFQFGQMCRSTCSSISLSLGSKKFSHLHTVCARWQQPHIWEEIEENLFVNFFFSFLFFFFFFVAGLPDGAPPAKIARTAGMTEPGLPKSYSFSQHCPSQAQGLLQPTPQIAQPDMQATQQQIRNELVAAVNSGRITPQQAVATIQAANAVSNATAAATGAAGGAVSAPRRTRQPSRPARPSSRASQPRTPQPAASTNQRRSGPEAAEQSPAPAGTSAVRLGTGVNSPAALNTSVKSPAIAAATDGQPRSGSHGNLAQVVTNENSAVPAAAEMSPWQKPTVGVASNPGTPLNTATNAVATAANPTARAGPTPDVGVPFAAVPSPLRGASQCWVSIHGTAIDCASIRSGTCVRATSFVYPGTPFSSSAQQCRTGTRGS